MPSNITYRLRENNNRNFKIIQMKVLHQKKKQSDIANEVSER